jgi:hypothetical protein
MDFSALESHQDMLSPGNAEVAQLRADTVSLLTQIDEREGLRTQKVVPLPPGMWNALYRLEPAGVVVNYLRPAPHSMPVQSLIRK